MNKKERTLVILISEKWRVEFENGDDIILSKSGDYVIYDAMAHKAEGLEKSHLIVVR